MGKTIEEHKKDMEDKLQAKEKSRRKGLSIKEETEIRKAIALEQLVEVACEIRDVLDKKP